MFYEFKKFKLRRRWKSQRIATTHDLSIFLKSGLQSGHMHNNDLTMFLNSQLGACEGPQPVCTVSKQKERQSEVLLVVISLCCVSRLDKGTAVRSGVISWLNRFVCVHVCLSCWLCVSVSKRVFCVSIFVCMCVWRISVPLQSSGCNQTGHWLHDVPQPPPPPTAGAPLSLSPCHVCLAAGLGTLAVC